MTIKANQPHAIIRLSPPNYRQTETFIELVMTILWSNNSSAVRAQTDG